MGKRDSLLNTIKNGFLDAAYIWQQEFKIIFKDQGVIIFLFLLPLGYPLIYGLIYNPEVMHEVPVVIVDNSRSTQSREYCRMLDATPQIDIVSYAANIQEAKEVIREEGAYVIMEIEKDFAKNIVKGKQANVMMYPQMYSLLYYRTVLSAATDVNMQYNVVLQEEQVKSATEKQQSMSVNPVLSYSFSLFNPSSGFATFIMPAVEIMVIQQSLLLAIGMLAGTMRERNPNHRLIPFNKRYFGTLRVIFGKGLCFLTISILTCTWAMDCVPAIFSFPKLGNPLEVMIFLLPFILSSILLGMTFSCLIRGREMPMLFFVFMSLPLIFISGISWPWTAVPEFWKAIGIFIPSTYAIQGYVQLSSCGATMADIKEYYMWEWCLVLIYFVTTFIVYRYQIKKTMNILKEEPEKEILENTI